MSDQPILVPASPRYVDVAPRRYWPRVTLILLAVNFIIFGLEMYLGGADNTQVLLNLGAAYGPYLRRGELWRLVMPIFLHGGWWHILGNSYALFILGPILERVYGYGRYAAIYILAGMAGALLSMEISKNVSVGASGAIFGIAGAMVVTGYAHREVVPPRWGRAFGRGMIPFIALNLALGFSVKGVDNWCHLGGLTSGALLALLIPPPKHELSYGELWNSEPPSESIVALPAALVLISMLATAQHYRTLQNMDRLLTEGERYETAHQFASEYQSFQQALKVAPREEEPHEELGNYYLAQKQFDRAIQEFQAADRLTEGDQRTRLELGLAYQLSGDPEKAQKIFAQVLGKNPQNAEEREALAANQVQIGDVLSQQKLYRDSIKAYQEALKLQPNLAVAHNNLAWLYATCDDLSFRNPKAALQHAQQAVDLTQGKQGDFLDTLAEAHFANGEFQQAVETQKQALELEPDNKELQQHMARYRQAAGT